MPPGDLTAIIASITAMVSAPGFVLWLNKRKTPTVTTVATMLLAERNALQDKLDKQATEHDRKIASLQRENIAALAAAEARCQDIHARDQVQIKQLHDEIDSLYRRLYQTPPIA